MSENSQPSAGVARPPLLEMRGVTVAALRDPAFTLVEDANWTAAAGEFWVVAGLPHSGKSDWLMVAAGLMPPVAGSCKLFGNDTRDFTEAELAERLRVGFVFQGGRLFNQLTVAENVALPLRYQKNLTAAEAARAVAVLLAVLELAPVADVTPPNLAAHWRQRAALARALILKPELLLLDSPLAGLGARHLRWWLRFLDELSRGHELLDGQPVTLVMTAEDFSRFAGAPGARKKFAALHGKKFIPLGAWSDVEASGDARVKELLAEPAEAAAPAF